jgi:hypothetical protein
VRSNLKYSFFSLGESKMTHRAWPFLAIAISVVLMACSSAPPTPLTQQNITDARNNFKASDYNAALRNLDKAIKSAPDESQRQEAVVLHVALVTALADANKQMAEAFYLGAKQPAAQSHSSSFYKARSNYYNTGRSFLMDAMQSVMDQRSKLGGNAMPIEVSFPGFTGSNPGMTNIKSGRLVSDAERSGAELQADRNALALVLSAIGGAGQDPNKGQQIYGSGKVDLDPRVYLIELSNSFLQTSTMFDYRGLNEPDHLRTVLDVVRGNLEIAEKLLAAKPDKDLEARVKKLQADCEKALKQPGR